MGEHALPGLLPGLGKLFAIIFPELFRIETQQRPSRFEVQDKHFANGVCGGTANQGRPEALPARAQERYGQQRHTAGMRSGQSNEPGEGESDLGLRSIDDKLLPIDVAEPVE